MGSSYTFNQIEKDMLQRGVQRSFNPPAALHHGEVWERLIHMVQYLASGHFDGAGLEPVTLRLPNSTCATISHGKASSLIHPERTTCQ